MEEREDIDITFSPDQVRALRDLLQQLKPEEDVENDLDYQIPEGVDATLVGSFIYFVGSMVIQMFLNGHPNI